MPVYTEKVKDKTTGKLIDKIVDGKKQYYIRTYVKDQFGNSKQITRHNKDWIGIDGKKEANWEERKLQNSIYNDYSKMTLDELFEKYKSEVKKNLSESSYRRNCDNYKNYIQNELGFKIIHNITTNDILELHNKLDKKTIKQKHNNPRREKGVYSLSTTYKRTIHTTLASILNFGCKYFELEKNVASIVGNYKKCKNINEFNYLTFEEFNKFIICETNETYKDFFTLLFYTGMRKGELVALELKNIDFKNREIKISQSINLKFQNILNTPKTKKSNRIIQMSTIVYDILLKYRQNTDTFIFGPEKIKATTLARKCDNNCIKANIDKNIRIHDFRHSFATLCLNNGVPIEIIRDYLGHEDISTTINIYAHLYKNAQDELIKILNKFA